MYVVLKQLKQINSRESYLGCIVSVVFVHRDSTAANSAKRLTQRLLNGLHSRQWPLQSHLVTGVKSAPTEGDGQYSCVMSFFKIRISSTNIHFTDGHISAAVH